MKQGVVLNTGQRIAASKMQDFLSAYNTFGQHFVLTGGPGTGKTFLTDHVVKGGRNKTAGVTISHAAKSVLASHITGIECYTLASFLGMKMSNDDLGNITFKPDSLGYMPMKKYENVILDEASMIDDEIYDFIMDIAREEEIRIVAIGDKYQLPPVEQDHDSKFFSRIDAELIQPMRFTGPIGDLAEVFRKEIEHINDEDHFDKYILNSYTKRENNYDDINSTGYTFYSKIDEVMEQAAHAFKTNSGNVNHTRILAFKNKTVDIVNNGIRNLVYGTGLKQFEEGEILIANNNINPTGASKSNPIIHNGQILEVESYIIDDGPWDIPCAFLKFKGIHNRYSTPFMAVSRDDDGAALFKYKSTLNRLRSNAIKNPEQWYVYYKFLDSFLQYDYAYAVNLYRAQGSTLEDAYVLDGEVMDVKPLTWKQKFQALYVAMTRPKKNLVFYNKYF